MSDTGQRQEQDQQSPVAAPRVLGELAADLRSLIETTRLRLDFLGLKDAFSERDLEATILREIERFQGEIRLAEYLTALPAKNILAAKTARRSGPGTVNPGASRSLAKSKFTKGAACRATGTA